MDSNANRSVRARGKWTALIATAGLALAAPALAKLDAWREDTASAFAKGRRDRVVVADSGKVRLGHELKPLGSIDAARVWDLARGKDGAIYASTGDGGKVFRRAGGDAAAWELAYDAEDTQALSLAVAPDGHVLVGLGPSGQVVDATDPKHPASRPHAGVQYIWDLAFDRVGNLYAATGPTGQLWKRSPEGAWSLALDSKHNHLLCVAVGQDGSVYAGSDGEGLVYKVAPGGKTSVLYDAPQTEVRALLVGAEGSVYAGTAAESGSGGSSRPPSLFSPGGSGGGVGGSRAELAASTGPDAKQDPPLTPDAAKKAAAKSASPPGGGSAAPRPPSPGENAVYRIDADGVARELFRAKTLIFALAFLDDRLVIGTGPEGQVYEVRDHGHETTPLARLDNGHVLALLGDPAGGGLLLGAGEPGAVVRLESNYVARGTLTSEVRDTKLVNRFGALSWRAEAPKGTAVALQVRTGNVSEPDETWSAWSAEQTDPSNASAGAPAGRFVQYRATLSTTDPTVTPELKAVTLRYQSPNLPPEIARLDVPDVSALDGATRQTRLNLRWDASDPNDDDLNYTLFLHKDGWPDWVKLTEEPLTDKTYAWDVSAIPDGLYRLRLVATDRPSNNAADSLVRERLSEPFLIDHEPPTVAITRGDGKAAATLRDRATRIARVAYAVDGGEWVSVFADDGLFDTSNERVTIPLDELKSGTHVLVVRATDAAGNVGTGDAVIEIR
jgi:hypothetical protein